MPLITCRNVSLQYESTVVVEDVSFAVEEGDYLCIVGENGTGKSTLLKGLLGLLPLRGGEISFSGMERREIGYLPQQTPVQRDFPASVFEVVLSGTLGRMGRSPFYSREAKCAARENMARLGVDKLAKRSYRDLSGGQQQRVLLARALCATKKLLILDEPVAGLDPLVTSELYALIRKLNREGLTVLMVTHDLSGVLKDANKLLHLDKTVRFFGTPAAYLDTRAGQRMAGGGSNAGVS